jgi:hypothetical protein
MNVRRTAALSALPLALVLAGASPALASGGGGGGVRASGPCATGNWNLKAKVDDGRLAVESEVDTNRVGQKWVWRLSDNGTQFASGTSTTAAPSGSFEIRRTTANRAGSDTVSLVATRGATTCRGAVTLP